MDAREVETLVEEVRASQGDEAAAMVRADPSLRELMVEERRRVTFAGHMTEAFPHRATTILAHLAGSALAVAVAHGIRVEEVLEAAERILGMHAAKASRS